MAPAQVRAILRRTGLLAADGDDGAAPAFERPDESRGLVERHCEIVAGGDLPGPGVPLVVQVSRWDRLKDPVGVLRGFAEVESDGHGAYLVLAGPSLGAVTDDPDSAAVLTEVAEEWHRLPAEIRSRVLLACLPMDDLDENAAIVNALQRQATDRRAEEPQGGLRPDRHRGDVEGPAGDRDGDRRDRGPDRRRGQRRAAEEPARPGGLRRRRQRPARVARARPRDRRSGARERPRRFPREPPHAAVRRAARAPAG